MCDVLFLWIFNIQIISVKFLGPESLAPWLSGVSAVPWGSVVRVVTLEHLYGCFSSRYEWYLEGSDKTKGKFRLGTISYDKAKILFLVI